MKADTTLRDDFTLGSVKSRAALRAGRPQPWHSKSTRLPTLKGEGWVEQPKARILSFRDWKKAQRDDDVERGETEARTAEVVREAAPELDLFELMAQWKTEDGQEDLQYVKELDEELRELRHLPS